MTGSNQAWEQALDAFEARLDAQVAALAGGPQPVPPFVPADSLGPMPTHLRPRAEVLLGHAIALEGLLERSLAAQAERLAARPAARSTTVATPPRFVDVGA